MLNRIQFRRIRREENDTPVCLLGEYRKPAFSVKRCVVHHYDDVGWQVGQQAFFKPTLKQAAIHGSFIAQGFKNRLTELRCDNPRPLEFLATDFTLDTLTSFSPTVLAMQASVDPCFIDIRNGFWWYLLDLFLVLSYLLWFLLAVAYRLFFRVIPSFRSAFITAVSVQPNASPIS